MRIAITGGTGFVGSYVTSLLADRGHDLVHISRGKRRRRSKRPNVTAVRADVATGDGLAEVLTGCDAVVHLVAIIVEKGNQRFDTVNRQGTANVAQAARTAGVGHMVMLSALGAGPDPKYTYLLSKWAGEQAVRISGVPATIIRSSLIFGPGDGFFTKLVKLVKLTPPLAPLPIAGDGRTLFQPIAAQDVAQCIAICLERGPNRSIIDVGGPEHLSYEEIIDIISAEVVSLPRPHLHVPVMALTVPAMVLSALMRDPLVTPGQLKLLALNNITRLDAVPSHFGFQPQRFTENCAYLRDY